jgi:hypothetical protein
MLKSLNAIKNYYHLKFGVDITAPQGMIAK